MPKRVPDGFSTGKLREVMREENRIQPSQGLTSFDRKERDRVRNEAAAARSRADEAKRKQLDEWRDVIR